VTLNDIQKDCVKMLPSMGWVILVICLLLGLEVEGITRQQRQSREDMLTQHCVVRSGCMREGGNMLGSLVTEFPFHPPGIQSTRQSCQEACAATESCKYFTWYDRDGAFPFTCFLYSTCDQEELDCEHCYSGPGVCRDPGKTSCSPIMEDYGGTWYCFPDVGLNQPVPHGTKCIWQCPGQSLYHQCDNGAWSERPGKTRCMCQKIGLEHQGEILCHPPHRMTEAVTSGTYCLHTCHGHPKTEMMCEHSLWSNNPAELTCEGNQTASFTKAKSLEMMSKEEMGARAHKKLREMKTKEDFDKPVMKTKIDGQILTMKKVNDIPDFLSKFQNQKQHNDFNIKHLFHRPEQPQSQNSIDVASNANFLQKLKDAQLSLSSLPTPQKLIQDPPNMQNSIPVIFVNNNVFKPAEEVREEKFTPAPQKVITSAPQKAFTPEPVRTFTPSPQPQIPFTPAPQKVLTPVSQPSPPQFTPAKNVAQGIQFTPINNPSTQSRPQTNLARFPQKEEEIVLITEKAPSLAGFDNFGFHQIVAPNLKPISGLEQVVTSQLQVGGGSSAEIPQQRNKPKPQFSQLFPPKTLEDINQIEQQMHKLEELEHLLETTDNLSPLTLEMVQSALISLKQKKSIAENVKSRFKQGTVTNLVTNNVPRFVHNNQFNQKKMLHDPLRDGKSFLPDPEMISVKGNAPLLVPHPGNNMTPMSDDAIHKQNKLRGLRKEMMEIRPNTFMKRTLDLEMKSKIAELEAKGINPTREHVKSHLNNIKTFTFNENPLPLTPRPARAPVKIQNSFLPSQPVETKMKDTLIPPTAEIIVGKQIPKFQQVLGSTTSNKGNPLVQFKKPVQNGPKLVRVKVPNPKFESQKIDFKKLSAMSELENDIGEVIDGLTELADRFPEDFKSLMKTFHNQQNPDPHGAQFQEPHSTHARNISPMEILNLANMITQANEVSGCTKPANPPHGKILCNTREIQTGSKCLLQCQFGFIPAQEELTKCNKGGSWSNTNLRCVRPVAMIIGGYNVEEGLLSDVELYSTSGSCGNVKIAPIPAPRRGLIAAWVGGSVLACGGQNNTQENNLCWRYDPVSNSWAEVAPLAKERHFGSVVPASGSLVVLGGRDGSAQPMAMGDIEQFDVDSFSWHPVKTKMTMERSYQCAVSLARDKLLVTGGYSWNSILGKTEALNMSAGDLSKWSSLSNLNAPRYLHACSQVLLAGGEVGVIVSGGYSNSYLNSTEIFHPSEDRWAWSGSMSVARQGASMVILDGKPTVLGGFHDYDKYPTITEQYDHTLGFWFPLKKKLRKGRRYFGVAAVPETLFPQCRHK